MLPQECREAFLVQTMHPYFQLTKREKGLSAACASVGGSWQERQREREKKSVCLLVWLYLRGPTVEKNGDAFENKGVLVQVKVI